MAQFLISKLRGWVANRRGESRFKARLPLSVSSSAPGVARRPQAIEGYTRDVSASGLGFVVPSARPGDRRLSGPTLRVSLLLGKRMIKVRAAPVRQAPLDPGRGEGESGSLVGARITEIDDGDRAFLIQHLNRIRRRVMEHAP
jgi:hypothetical protein